MSTQCIILAEYFVTELSTLLFIVRADFKKPYVVEIKRPPLQEIRQFVIEQFREVKEDLNIEAYQKFFQPLVDPLVATSPQGDRMTDEGDIIWFVPHDVLHYLPLHALHLEGRYLIERNPVCYTPSASVMKYCHAKRKGRCEQALILADPLEDRPYTREQALVVQTLFPKTEVYLGNSATKALLRRRLAEVKDNLDVLHFACHGYFCYHRPLKSGIKLAPEGSEPLAPQQTGEEESPWNLTAEEIFSLEMKADLVTLSACQSGVAERRPGDELIGLTRAFIYAGTPSVLVSLWSVDEVSTSILIQKFYNALRAGKNKAESLQQAQVELMRMSTQEIIAYCEQAKARLQGTDAPIVQSVRRLLDWDIAITRFSANDFQGALDDYSRLKEGLNPDSGEYRKLKNAIERCKGAQRSRVKSEPDYEMHIYEHLYHWAPFVLVGDWK